MATKQPKNLTKNAIIEDTTTEYLNAIDQSHPPEPRLIEEELLENIAYNFELKHNAVAEKGRKWKIPDTLSAYQISSILLHLHHIVRISCTDRLGDDENLLCIYLTDGLMAGTYTTDERIFKKLIYQYNHTATKKEIEEILERLDTHAPQVLRTRDPDLIAVGNGIFDYKTKTLLPFSPDYVFTTKSTVNYNPMAVNQNIHNPKDNTDWDVESWFLTLSDDPEIRNLIWEIIGATIRPNVRWNKSAWFYSTTGNNGKGTLCQLMRNVCGEQACASISLMEFNKEFKLGELLHASAIINDENAVGSYVDNAANLKSIITGDMFQLNRKFKNVISYRFHGFMVQCLNEYPKIRDRTDSFYRRQLFIPFDNCFTGKEREYIKSDYLKRKEVLEYILKKVLHMDYYRLSEPQACVNALQEYKSFNDPVRQFAEEILPLCTWDLLPFTFLYDLYKSWFFKNIPNGTVQNSRAFKDELIRMLPQIGGWFCKNANSNIRTGSKMDKPEHLILDYNLVDWKNPRCTNKDTKRLCMPALKPFYRGILRDISYTEDDLDDQTDTTDTA